MDKYYYQFNLIYGVDKKINYPKYLKILKKASEENLENTIKILLYLRDIKNGKGEREIFRDGILWIALKHPTVVEKYLYLIPKIGRWDDLFIFFSIKDFSNLDFINKNYCIDIDKNNIKNFEKFQNKVLTFFCNQLKKDRKELLDKNYNKISNLAKWAPSEGCSIDKKYGLVKLICKEINIHPKTYRVSYLTPLREKIGIVEHLISSKKIKNIKYHEVPELALKKYNKTFLKYDKKRWSKWKLHHNKKKIKYHPYEIIQMYNNYELDNIIRLNIEKEWNFIKNSHNNELNIITMIDNTSSMYYRELREFLVKDRENLNKAISIALLLSKKSSFYKNHILNFHENPTFNLLSEDQELLKDITDIIKFKNTQKINFINLIKLVKTKCKDLKSLPNILIITDQNFSDLNEITENYLKNNNIPIYIWNINSNLDFEIIQEKYWLKINGFSNNFYKNFLKINNLNFQNNLKNLIDLY